MFEKIQSRIARRHFLQFGAAGLFGLTLPASIRAKAAGEMAPSGGARNVIFIWLGGGPATIDMWDPKPDAPDYIRGEFNTIATALPEVRICEHLPEMAQTLDRCALVRSLSHSIPAHGPGSQYMLTGHLPSAATEHPSLSSVATRLLQSSAPIPPYVAFDSPPAGAGYLGSAYGPFELDGQLRHLPVGVSLPENADRRTFDSRVGLRNQFDRRFDRHADDPLANALDAFQQQAVDVLRKNTIRKALDVEGESEQLRKRYGLRSALGRNALRACRLIEAGARFVTVGTTGWDTHFNNFTQLRNNLLPALDRAVSSLIVDLEARGLLSSTIVCCCGEFGRTPNVNGRAGRDHWSRAMSVLLAGGGLKAGFVHGATDKHGGEAAEGACAPADLAATLFRQLGIDPTTTISMPSGREMPVVRDAKVIEEIIA